MRPPGIERRLGPRIGERSANPHRPGRTLGASGSGGGTAPGGGNLHGRKGRGDGTGRLKETRNPARNPGTDGTASEFPAKGAGNPWQARQSPSRLLIGD